MRRFRAASGVGRAGGLVFCAASGAPRPRGAPMSEWLWLLLPVAAASGWLAATAKSRKEQAVGPKREIPPEYLTGLGFLLNQQPDKATEIFIKLFEVDSDTVETHLVLGNLFRQKGEVERAIHIHQNVIERPRLSDYHRAQAMLELGRDYFSAGLLDRAEHFFNHVILMQVEQVRLEAYSHLVSLYEIEKSWEQAIEYAEKLKRHGVDGYSDRVSHYYCELAEQALRQKNYALAERLLPKPKSGAASLAALRVAVLKGDIDLERGEIEAAEKQYVKAFKKYPEYSKLLLPRISAAFKRMNVPGFFDYLKGFKPEVVNTSYLLALFQALIEDGRVTEAENLFFDLTEQRRVPLPVLRLYLEHREKKGVADKALFIGIVRSLAANEEDAHSYQCTSCGFEAHQLHWQCPSCHRWGTAQPQDAPAVLLRSKEAPGVSQASAA